MKDGFLLMAAGMVLVTVLLGYFLGCLNGSVMVSHFVIKDDVRQHGSGNAGLTNFYRTYGAKYALGVILFDMGKTVIACLLGGFLLRHGLGDWTLGVLIGGLGCELGHMFPVFFGFKGGKGILSGGTLVWLLDWRGGGPHRLGAVRGAVAGDKVRVAGVGERGGEYAYRHVVLLRAQRAVYGAGGGHRGAGGVVSPGEYTAAGTG